MRRAVEILAVALVGVVLVLAIADNPATGIPTSDADDLAANAIPVREAVIKNGVQDTGARNLVTSVYLGYRAFDTLGETIVLLMSVSGVVYLIGKKGR